MVEGELRDLPLTDLLQMVAGTRKDGVLRLEKSGARARLLIVEGRLVDARTEPGPHLAEVLVRQELLPLREVLELLGDGDQADLVAKVAVLAKGKRAAVTAALEAFLLDVVAHLLSWRHGAFSFVDGGGWLPPVQFGGIEVGSALLRVGSALELVDSERPQGVAFRTTGDATKVALPSLSWEVLGFIDGRRSSEMVAAEAGLPEWQVNKLLLELEGLGVIEPSPFQVAHARVLVVSGNPGLARLLRQLVSRCRSVPVPATSPAVALSLAAREHLRAAVVDDSAGGGQQLIQDLRRLPGKAHLPMVLLEEARQSPLLGRLRRPRVLTLRKPFAETEFLSLLSRMVATQAA